MPNILESLYHTFRTLIDNEPKQPLHVGEVMGLWTYMAALREADEYVQVGLNTTTDAELSDALREALQMCKGQIDRLQKFFKEEGVSLPPASEEKPKCHSRDIPLGVKLTDSELANGLSLKTTAMLVMCGSGMAEAIRTDVGQMFFQFQLEAITYGATLKPLMRKRGWLKIPPLYTPPGLPLSQ